MKKLVFLIIFATFVATSDIAGAFPYDTYFSSGHGYTQKIVNVINWVQRYFLIQVDNLIKRPLSRVLHQRFL